MVSQRADHGTFSVEIAGSPACSSSSSLSSQRRRTATWAAVFGLVALFALVTLAEHGRSDGRATGLMETELQAAAAPERLTFAPYITSGIVIRDPEGRSFKFDKENNVIRLNAGTELTFSVLFPARSDSSNNFTGTEYMALKGGEEGYLRHAGYVCKLTPWAGYVADTAPNGTLAYDYAWRFIASGNNTFKIKSKFSGGYYLGYQADSDDLRIMQVTEANATKFTIDGNPGNVVKTWYADCSEYAKESKMMLAGKPSGGESAYLFKLKPPLGGMKALEEGKEEAVVAAEGKKKDGKVERLVEEKNGEKKAGVQAVWNLKSRVWRYQEKGKLNRLIATGQELKKQELGGKGPAVEEKEGGKEGGKEGVMVEGQAVGGIAGKILKMLGNSWP